MCPVKYARGATPFGISAQVLKKKLRKKICFSCRIFVLYANFLIFYARIMQNCSVVAMIPLSLPLATEFGNGGVFRFSTLSHIKTCWHGENSTRYG